jgi:hypothetical protein
MLDIKYSLVWLFGIIAIFLLTLNPWLINKLAEILGVYDAMNALLFIALAFLTCICISLTVAISRLSGKIKELVQISAIMEKEHHDKFHLKPDEKFEEE